MVAAAWLMASAVGDWLALSAIERLAALSAILVAAIISYCGVLFALGIRPVDLKPPA